MSGIVGQNLGRGSGLVKKTAVDADSVTGASIADDAIDSEHYTDGSIDNAHLADDAVDSDELAAGAVDTAHIADNQVTLAKMAGLARGKIIYGDASGDPAALAVGSANYVLTSDGTDTAWAAASGGGIDEIDMWRINTDITLAQGGQYEPDSAWERCDTANVDNFPLGTGMTESSGIFTFPSTGWWLITGSFMHHISGGDYNYLAKRLYQTANNSTWQDSGFVQSAAGSTVFNGYDAGGGSCVFDVTDTSNHKVRMLMEASEASIVLNGSTNINYGGLLFVKLAET